MNNSSITDWVRTQISKALRLPEESMELDVPFQEYGVDSILLADLVKQLEKQLGDNVNLSPSVILEHPTIGMLSDYFAENFPSHLSKILNQEIATESQSKEPQIESTKETSQRFAESNKASNSREPIAVIAPLVAY